MDVPEGLPTVPDLPDGCYRGGTYLKADFPGLFPRGEDGRDVFLPVDEDVRLVAVRVDPSTGYLYAPVAVGGDDPVDVVLAFLDSISGDELENRVLTEQQDTTVGRGTIEVLKAMARDAR